MSSVTRCFWLSRSGGEIILRSSWEQGSAVGSAEQALGYSLIASPQDVPRSLAGKPLAGFCATRSRRIQDLYGMVVHVIRCNTHYAIDNRR